jgi:hypothetical protein
MRIIYLIDGVRVTKKIYDRRQVWGEYPGANFQTVVIREDRRD